MKKNILSLLILACLAGAAPRAEAYRDFDLKNRFMCFNFGLSRALWSELQDGGNTVRTEYDNPEWLYTFGMRIWIWKVGFGMDYTDSSVLNAIVAYNLYYRVFLGRQVAAFGGIGMSMTMGEQFTDFGIGYNLRLGGEILLTEDISLAGVITWDTVTMFSYMNPAFGSEAPKMKLASFSIQANLYLF